MYVAVNAWLIEFDLTLAWPIAEGLAGLVFLTYVVKAVQEGHLCLGTQHVGLRGDATFDQYFRDFVPGVAADFLVGIFVVFTKAGSGFRYAWPPLFQQPAG